MLHIFLILMTSLVRLSRTGVQLYYEAVDITSVRVWISI